MLLKIGMFVLIGLAIAIAIVWVTAPARQHAKIENAIAGVNAVVTNTAAKETNDVKRMDTNESNRSVRVAVRAAASAGRVAGSGSAASTRELFLDGVCESALYARDTNCIGHSSLVKSGGAR